ncbi:MAG: anthranilate phosphoribosyltransferase [Gemmatimonadota bacterium]
MSAKVQRTPIPDSALNHALELLEAGIHLSRNQSRAAFDLLMDGTATADQMERLLLALRSLGETSEEIAGAADSLRAVMVRLSARPGALVDTCGTGGGRITTFNISSASSFVAAGAGVRVAKHGNRSHTTRSGSADLFESLGVDIGLSAERAGEVLGQIGLVFLFAPQYHPAMRHVGPTRKKLGVSTIMNLVGPLANPAGVRRQVMGVFDATKGPTVADALLRLGAEHAVVVHAQTGMDEISPSGMTDIWEVKEDRITHWLLDPEEFGLACHDLPALAGGDSSLNAARVERLLSRERDDDVGRCAVLLNAAAAIYVAEQGISFSEAVDRARSSLENGAAEKVLHDLRREGTREAGSK